MNTSYPASGSRRVLLAAALSAVVVAITACGGGDDNNNGATGTARNVLYVESNHLTPGQNSVIGYARAADGSLTPLPGSPFLTGGKGHNNPTAGLLGPNDLDQPMVASDDKKRLYAVNAGSDTIAVFNVAADGTLAAVAGSPFPSGGRNPVSVEIAGNRLYVVNKNEDADQLPNAELPNYTAFTIESDGRLTPIANSTIPVIKGGSPTQVLASRDDKLIFGTDFFAPAVQPGIGSLRSFRVNADGTLTQAPGSAATAAAGPVSASDAEHPVRRLRHPQSNRCLHLRCRHRSAHLRACRSQLGQGDLLGPHQCERYAALHRQ